MIIFKLLALPVTAPAAGIKYCIERVVELAEQELYDDEAVRQELLELHLRLEEGEIGEEEFAEQEAVLLARIREIREYRREQARGSAEASPAAEGDERKFVIEVPEELE